MICSNVLLSRWSYFDLGFGKRAPRFVVKTDGKIKGTSSTTVRVCVFAIST